MKEISKIIGI